MVLPVMKMSRERLKYIFIASATILLAIMLCGSRFAGVSCDEVLHYGQSVAVYNYFASGGNDRQALETGESQLKYYGQSFDNITTLLIKAFRIDDIYRFRHVMASFAGWLAIIIAALFAVWLAGYESGIVVILLFAVSPTFLGHSQNNLKDVPFALGYISAIIFMVRFLTTEKTFPITDAAMLLLSIAFTMSIRAGGMMLICFLMFFAVIILFLRIYEGRKTGINSAFGKFGLVIFISAAAWLLSVVMWPYGLQNPVVNPVKAHLLMSRFPLTFREIFEGKVQWTDYMPWYYLLKYMAVTIPLIVTAGLAAFLLLAAKTITKEKILPYLFLGMTVVFPVLYVIYSRPNIYSGWRQFLFLYPGIVIFSASGIVFLFRMAGKRKILKWFLALLLAVSAVHPVKYLITDYKFAYIYYNQLVGGLKGANGNYETDYYFIGQSEAAEWLNRYIEKNKTRDTVIVGSNFSASWYFRKNPMVKNIYFRNEERSNYNWDFYISTNRYIIPSRLKNGLWPPGDALKVVYAGGAPVCAVIERKSKDSYYGYIALKENRLTDAEYHFSEALKLNSDDEMIFYNFAVVLNRANDSLRADSVLKISLKLNPFFEPALMYAGIISERRGDYEKAAEYFERLTGHNMKYSEAYIRLAEIEKRRDVVKARSILRECLRINPGFKPALTALADLYRLTDPDVAEKYDSLAKSRDR